MPNFRQIALDALLYFSEKGGFIEDYFHNTKIDDKEKAKARELAIGTLRQSLSLKELGVMLNGMRPIKLKGACLWLLKMAIYQYKWMTGLPSYAIVSETVEIAKRYSLHQAKFLNALLRKITSTPSLKDIQKESIRYSIPEFVYSKLKASVPEEKWLSVLESISSYPKTMLRSKELLDLPKIASFNEGDVYLYEEGEGSLKDYLLTNGVYVQNITPIELMYALYNDNFCPTNVLDVCAAPGGKLILAHALFPKATLYGADVSQERLAILKDNLDRLSIKATTFCQDGRKILPPLSSKDLYDLVILDAPCSNTGVMHKKVEAKYRLSEAELLRLVTLSHELLMHAKTLISERGQIWFMTCSLLFEENGAIIPFAEQIGLKMVKGMTTFYPDKNGRDGGFGVAFERK